jgi:ribonuclease R
MARRRDKDVPPVQMPSRDAVREFIRKSTGRVGKREIERAFRLGPEHRVALRGLLKDMAGEGVIAPAGHRRFTPAGRLPDATIVQVTGTDPDGDAIARPVEWAGDGPPPMVLMAPEPRGHPALAPGERVLARLRPIGHGKSAGKYEGRTLKRLTDAPGRVLGVFRAPDRLVPTDRRQKAEWTIAPADAEGAEDGEIVLCIPLPSRSYGLKSARVVERLGRLGDARSVSLICIYTFEIPNVFAAEAIAEAEAAQAVPLGAREDLRPIPLVTIDGEDARDFDDAVFAEPDGDGYRLIVAIADVAHYVRTGSALDRTAWERGNSVYFPDRVVPMLPEALSNGWCSLRPHEDRGCLLVEMRVDAAGRKTSHRFGRGLMRSAARLTYEQVQAAHDASEDLGLPIGPLYAAFRALLAARQARGTLDLDLPERRVVLDDAGHVTAITPRPRLDSHRLIEEFMVLANVAAAEELEHRHLPCMYRLHAPPSDEKLEALRSFLHGMSIGLPPQGQVHPRDLDAVLKQVAGTEQAPLVNEVVLRSQSQAQYGPDNIGHFGLALSRYAHFTSPIRRYADLCVHRALIRGLGLGADGLKDDEAARFEDTAEHITATERRAALAEREAIDRYLAAFMADKCGAQFAARISGVTRFGLFVTLAETGASGLVPLSALPDDYWVHDETTKSLTGRRTGMSYHLAQSVDVRLVEASPVTGGLIFSMAPALRRSGNATAEAENAGTATHGADPSGARSGAGSDAAAARERRRAGQR